MKPLTKEWVDKAEGDYKVTADESRTEEPVWDAACFHAQQCSEKYLKAWLIEQGIAFPKTHYLAALAKSCLASLPEISTMMEGLNIRTSLSAEVRYPGTWMGLTDAERSLQILRQFREIVRQKPT